MIRETQADPSNEWQAKRVGFVPDIMVQVVGTTFEGRQAILKRAMAYSGPDSSPPCFLEREPDNPHDPHCIGVHVGIDYSEHTGWTLVHVGFLPKEYDIPVRDRSNQLTLDGVGNPFKEKVWKLMDHSIGEIRAGVEGIYRSGGNYGLRLGLRHRMQDPNAPTPRQLFFVKKDISFPSGICLEKGTHFLLLEDSGFVEDHVFVRGKAREGPKGEKVFTNLSVRKATLESEFEPILDEDLTNVILDTHPEILGEKDA